MIADYFGTLIVCLPSPFKGGQLVLRHIDHNSSSASHTRTYDWSTNGDDMPQDLQWAAFYADTGRFRHGAQPCLWHIIRKRSGYKEPT
jgi:hypothetical protein